MAMATETADIICIYCKKTKPRPARGEHVVLDGLGGTTCIRDVCSGCNGKELARLGQDFLRDSPILLHRLYPLGAGRGQAQEPQFVPHPAFGGFLDCTILTSPIAVTLPPQAFVLDGKLTSITPTDDQASARDALQFFDATRNAPKVLHRAVRDVDEHEPARLVMYRKNGKWRFVLRARTEAAATQLLDALQGWSGLYDAPSRHFESSVDTNRPILRLRTPINVLERCITKMAFNFLTLHLGAAIALRKEFDPIRQYITGENVEPVREVEGPDGEVGFTVDTRFVNPWHEKAATRDGWWVVPDHHTLALGAHERNIFCHVHLFGGRESFIVSFGRVGEDVQTMQELPFFLVANPQAQTHDETFNLAGMLVRTGRATLSPEELPTITEVM